MFFIISLATTGKTGKTRVLLIHGEIDPPPGRNVLPATWRTRDAHPRQHSMNIFVCLSNTGEIDKCFSKKIQQGQKKIQVVKSCFFLEPDHKVLETTRATGILSQLRLPNDSDEDKPEEPFRYRTARSLICFTRFSLPTPLVIFF